VFLIADLVRDYGDPQAEALRCRQDCALFDFSFVYRVRVSGRDVIRRIEQFQPRVVSDMSIGQIRYSVRNDGQGRVRSDLTLWRFGEDVFEVMSGCKEDISDLRALAGKGFVVDDLSEATAILAVQGPNTLAQLARVMDVEPLRKLPYFAFARAEISAIPCLVGRLGYSGEAGFELLVEQSQKDRLWALLSRLFAPAGFAAIDILRIEAGFLLFTNECRVAPTISELGLSALFNHSIASPEIRLVAFRADTHNDPDLILWRSTVAADRRPDPGEIIVTSACFSPLFNSALGLGFVSCGLDCEPVIDPMKQFLDVKLCSLPPYDPHKSRPRRPWRKRPR
jgi:glycine cleavage system aminomethyltransferase T